VQPTAVARPAVALLALLLAACATAQVARSAGDDDALATLVAEHPVWGPALAHRTAATDAAERAYLQAGDEARRRDLGLSASLSFAPSVAWRGSDGAAATGPLWRSDVLAAVAYRYDAEHVARGRLDLHRAAVARTERAHRDLRAALGLHVDLQRAHLALAAAEEAATSRAATLAEAEAAELGRDPAAAPSTTLAAAQLAYERAVADVERAARGVADAARAAQAVGLDPAVAEALHRDRRAPLPLEGWRLWLPDADPEASPAVVRAGFDVAIAEAALARVRVGGVLDDLALDVAYALPELRLRATLDLDEGRPGAAVDAALRPAARSSWSVAVGATVRFDDRTASTLAAARADAEAAHAALATARAEAPWALEAARRAALDAEADVAFAERALELGRTALAEAVARHRTAVAEAVATPDADAARAARDRADAALARTAIGFDRERDAFYRAWSAYGLAVERYLVAAGSSGGVLAPP
jgi:hypothetical protein